MSQHKHNSTSIAAVTRPKCGTCVHFVADQGQAVHGHCRALPPSAAWGVRQGPLGKLEEVIKSAYPPTTSDKWCGAHPDFMRWWSEHREQFQAAVQIGDVATEGQA